MHRGSVELRYEARRQAPAWAMANEHLRPDIQVKASWPIQAACGKSFGTCCNDLISGRGTCIDLFGRSIGQNESAAAKVFQDQGGVQCVGCFFREGKFHEHDVTCLGHGTLLWRPRPAHWAGPSGLKKALRSKMSGPGWWPLQRVQRLSGSVLAVGRKLGLLLARAVVGLLELRGCNLTVLGGGATLVLLILRLVLLAIAG